MGNLIWDTHKLEPNLGHLIWDTHKLENLIWDTHKLETLIWDTHKLETLDFYDTIYGCPELNAELNDETLHCHD